MGYYTTVKTVNKNGVAVKAEIVCGGTSKGFTDANTGEISFEMSSNGSYNVSVKRFGKTTSGAVYGGKSIILRVE